MIENIYSSEGGDTGKAGKSQASFKMPKNVRQIGKSNQGKKIYVEDYVMTFIKQLAGGDYSGCKIAVLVGQCIRLDSVRNIFISGVIDVKDANATGEIVFTNDIWSSIYEDIKKHFTDVEIVGWFLGGPGYLMSGEEEKILKLHVDNFAGQDKVLLTYDNMEREEAFYSYENGKLAKQEGYYIYYEKNEEMQTYMIEHKKEDSAEANYDDQVSRKIRDVLQSKKTPEEEGKSVTRLMYAAGTLLAVIILVVGAAILSNYDQMKSMQDTLNYLTENLEGLQSDIGGKSQEATNKTNQPVTPGATGNSSGEGEDTEDDQSLDIEVVPGDVKPIEDPGNTDTQKEDNENDEEDPASGEELAGEEPDEGEEQDSDKTEATPVVSKEVKYYTVQSGDTLAGISYKLYNTYTKVKQIMELNNIDYQDLIYAGQKLIVP